MSNRIRHLLQSRPYVSIVLISFFLSVLFYYDVIFFSASAVPRDTSEVTSAGRVDVFPHFDGEYKVSTLISDDSANSNQFHAGMYFVRDVIYNGQSFLWNPHVGLGTYSVEVMTDSKFSLFSILCAVFGVSSFAIHLIVFIQLLLALSCLGILIYRYFNPSLFAATLASILFAFSGFYATGRVSQETQPFLFVPVLLLAGFLVVDRITVGRAGFLAAALIAMFSNTFFPILIACAVSCFVYFMYYMIDSKFNNIIPIMLIALLSFFILSFIYLPIYDSLKYTNFNAVYDAREFSTLEFDRAIYLVSPKLLWLPGYRQQPGTNPALQGFPLVAWLGASGVVMLLLTVTRRQFYARPLSAASVTLLLIALYRLCIPAAYNIFAYLPIVGSIKAKYWFPALTIAAVFIVAQFASVYKFRKRDLIVYSLILLLSVLYFAGTVAHYADRVTFDGRAGARTIAFFVILGLTFLLLSLFRDRPLRQVLLLAFMLVEFNYYLNPVRAVAIRDSARFPPYEAARKGEMGRVFNIGYYGMFPEWANAYGCYQLGSFNANQLSWFDRFMRTVVGRTSGELLAFHDIADINVSGILFSFLGVTDLLVSRSGRMADGDIISSLHAEGYAFRGRLGRVLQFETIADVRRYDLYGSWLERNGEMQVDYRTRVAPARPAVSIERYDHDRVDLKVSTRRPGLFVFKDVWHPYWKATVNGAPVKVWRVNGLLRGVLLKKGGCNLEFRYQPPWLGLVSWMTGVGIAGFILLLFWIQLHRKREFPGR